MTCYFMQLTCLSLVHSVMIGMEFYGGLGVIQWTIQTSGSKLYCQTVILPLKVVQSAMKMHYSIFQYTADAL